MSPKKRSVFVLLLAAAFFCGPVIEATSVLQMNLVSLFDRSEKIFRGRVVDSETGTVAVGGGELPVITYTIEVEEPFKGDFGSKPVVVIRQLWSKDTLVPFSGDVHKVPVITGVPAFAVGEEYVLFTTQPSAIGLSTTVGLGHGSFHITTLDKEELVVNEFNNVGIFAGMSGMPVAGPVTYTELADAIHTAAQGAN